MVKAIPEAKARVSHTKTETPSSRAKAHSVNDMSDYFEKIERVMREKGTTKLDVWNMDETGFQIGCGKAQLVVTMELTSLFI